MRRTVRRGGKPRKGWCKVTVLRPRIRVAFGQRVRIAGRLTTRDGQPLRGVSVYVYSRTPVSTEEAVTSLSTGADGRFAYRTRGSSTRTLRFVYPGSPTILPAQDEVVVVARARSAIRVSDRGRSTADRSLSVAA